MDVSPEIITIVIAGLVATAIVLLGTWRMLVHQGKRMDERFDRLDARFDRIDARFDRIDARLDDIDDRLGSVARGLTGVRISIARPEGPQPRLLVPHTR